MKTIRIFVCALTAAALVSCGGTTQPPAPVVTLTAADIRQMDNYEELLAALKSANIQLTGKDPAVHSEDFSRRAILQDKLVQLAVSQLDSSFTVKREDNGVIPLQTITNIAGSIAGASEVPAAKWQRVRDRVALEEMRTKDLVIFEAKKLEQDLSDSDTLNLLDELYRLTGESQWQQQKNAYIDGLISDIRDAKAEGRFDESVQAQVALVRELRGDDQVLADELAGYDAKVYENNFLQALGNGDPDGAFDIFTDMANSPDYELILKKLSGTAATMAEYFVAKADQAVLEPSQLANSYRWYQQGAQMHEQLGLGKLPVSRYQALLDQLEAKYSERMAAKDFEGAFAYLLMIGDFNKAQPVYRSNFNTIKRQIANNAVRRVTTTAFQNSAQRHDYGSVLSSFITQYLFEKIPYDVRIVERQQYEAILRERELSGQGATLSAVDYLITGSVLESKVDTTEVKGRKTLRVVVGRESIPNPAYGTWLELPNKERKKVSQPSETISVDKHENVTVGITEHRKLGIVSVGYRLVEADSGKIIFPDSITKEIEHKDTSKEGVEMGDFVMPFELAQLPSDVEILDGLVKELANEVGENLVGLLSDQEVRYLELAAEQGDNSNCPAQVKSMAKAAAILESKSLEFEGTLLDLRKVAVSCF